jgi:heat-inducible transcriptional repressor
MQLTERQKEILTMLVREYIGSAEPVSSELLKERGSFDISPATIRNDLQELAEQGYIAQPHTSAGRVPTEKAYRFFVTVTVTSKQPKLPEFITREITSARVNIQKELQKAEELVHNLRHLQTMLDKAEQQADHNTISEILGMLGPSRTSYEKHISLLDVLLEELENF